LSKEYILGISTSHNCTAALIDLEGNLIGVVSEERFTRQKNEVGFPTNAIKYLLTLREARDIKYTVIGEELLGGLFYNSPRTVLNNEERTHFFRNPLNMFANYIRSYIGINVWKGFSIEAEIKRRLKELGVDGELKFIEHHYAHGAGAYFTENFDNTLIITMDGQGNDKSACTFTIKAGELEERHFLSRYDSPGNLYAFITTMLGFKQNRHEGKITGLAAFGDYKNTLDKLSFLLETEEKDGEFNLKSPIMRVAEGLNTKVLAKVLWEYVRWLLSRQPIETYVYDLLDIYSKEEIKVLLPDFKASKEDIAAGVQYILEDRVCKFIDFYLKKYNCRNLILAGGVFANVKLNQRLFNLTAVDNIYIHPGMGDEGLALGGALEFLSKLKPGFKRNPIKTVYLGPEYTSDEIKTALDKEGLKYREVTDSKELAKITAKYLSESKIIGLFKGRMEYGPRALGARSVLADPRKKEMHDILNDRMKRTEFMPFAPVIAYERASEILEGKIKGSEHTAEFMTITYDVKKRMAR
jgi:carbamoyltransferase